MAAVLTPNRRPDALRHLSPPRPVRLTVIEGGRSPRRPAQRRVYHGRRAMALATFALAAWLVVSAIGMATSHAPVRSAYPSSRASVAPGNTYTARPGDTLWSVASALHVDGDVRDVVDRLAAVNGSDTLIAGQQLTIPADIAR